MRATSGKHQKEPNWFQLQLKQTSISKNIALIPIPSSQSSLTKHQKQFSNRITVQGDFDLIGEPPLLPSLGAKNKKSRYVTDILF
jgi:hypothetical protein